LITSDFLPNTVSDVTDNTVQVVKIHTQ